MNYEEIASKAKNEWDGMTNGKVPLVRIGTAMCGHAAGAFRVLDTLKKHINEKGIEANIQEVGCLGLCYAEPLIDIKKPGKSRLFFNNVDPNDIAQIVDDYLVSDGYPKEKVFGYLGEEGPVNDEISIESMPGLKLQNRIALRNAGHTSPYDINQYIANGGYSGLNKALSNMSPTDVIDEVKNSGLRGRGGAAFPTGVKWSFLVGSPGPTKYILCNCEEGDPGAFNDKGIIENDPHTLIEGLIINGYATRSTHGYVFIRTGHNLPIEAARKAIQEAYDVGLLGKNILGSEFSFEMEVSLTGDSYVAGEETALMEAIEGKRATPRFKPPFPAAAGLWQKPTNINNVKTLAYVPEIVRNGSGWFKDIGTETTSGTAIVCLSGHITYPGMYEIPMGMTIRDVLEKIGGGVSEGERIKVLQAGGPLNGLLGEDAFDTKIDFDAMSEAGASIGSGGIIVGNETTNVVDLLRNLIAFNQFESCGKCFPCRLGNTHMLEILDRMCQNKAKSTDLALIERVGVSMKAGSLCGHGQLGFNPIASALKYFGDEIEACLAGELPTPGVFGDGTMILPTRTRP